MSALEILFSARGQRELQELRQDMSRRFVNLPTTEADFQRAMDVIECLSPGGHHREVAIPDLLVSAVAERHQLQVIHYDGNFDRVAAVTGQAVRWVESRGTV